MDSKFRPNNFLSKQCILKINTNGVKAKKKIAFNFFILR